MKKSLIALAVLSAAGVASAQSTVTLYGLIDTYYTNAKFDAGTGVAITRNADAVLTAGVVTTAAKTGARPIGLYTAPGVATTQNLLQSGAVNGSRWGMKGSEDLGGGLSATFVLEAGINSDDGSGANALAFHRQASVGFAGGFGAVRVGRVPTVYYDVEGASDGGFNSALSAGAVAYRSASGGDTSIEKSNLVSRFDNSVRYDSPNVSGFVFSAQYGLTENNGTQAAAATPTAVAVKASDAGSNASYGVTYAGGPLTAQFAYQSMKATSIAATKSNTRLGGAYDFGAAKLKATWGRSVIGQAATGADQIANEYQIAVDVPVSSALTLSANFANSQDNIDLDASEGKRTAFGLSAAYTLSKRTFVYGGYVSGKKTATGSTADASVSALAVGVQHRF